MSRKRASGNVQARAEAEKRGGADADAETGILGAVQIDLADRTADPLLALTVTPATPPLLAVSDKPPLCAVASS